MAIMVHSERYKILKQLQKNKKVSKYLVFDELDKKKRVITEYHNKGESLKSEQASTKYITHQGLPHMNDLFYANEATCEVHEFIEGDTLSEYISTRGIPVLSEALEIFLKVLYIVKFLHDIKPEPHIHKNIHHENVILHQDKVYLVDYGIKDENKNPYSAPENILGITPGVQQDIYSLGMLLNFILTDSHKKPFGNKKFENTDIIIQRCIAPNVKNRYAETGILINECERLKEKIRGQSHGKITNIYACFGYADMIVSIAKHYCKYKKKKVLVVDADILQPSLYNSEYTLNNDLCSLLDANEEKYRPLKRAIAGCDLYIIPCYLNIEGYESITFTAFSNLLNAVSGTYDSIFIKCSDFIYDTLSINSCLKADRILYIVTDPVLELARCNALSEYLHTRHDIDKKRFKYITALKDCEPVKTTGLDMLVCGDYLADIKTIKKTKEDDYKKIIQRLGE